MRGNLAGAHARLREYPVQSVTCTAAGFRDQRPCGSTVAVMDLCPSQRDTSEIGTPSARAVLAKVCRGAAECAAGHGHVPHGPAHDARQYDVNGFYNARGEALDCLQVFNPLLNHGGLD